MDDAAARARMVREQLEARDVHDRRVLEAMLRVPRHRFVPEALRNHAYEDRPQPIGADQTISQPLMVGIMTELLHLYGDEHVLEVGTGSGYQTAILAELSASVVSIERVPELAERARNLLEALGYRNIEIHVGDGSLGYAPRAPYDRILVTAAAPYIPPPLIQQLAPRGRLVAPIGNENLQMLTIAYKDAGGRVFTDECGECMFVPLIGHHGFAGPASNRPPHA
ncbi:MAG: protein-L-isoaspartate(D-aspartate) O-methyltransferase [Chthonomonadales bacterium]